MKNFISKLLFSSIVLIIFQSCDPDVVGEGVTLSPLVLPFRILENNDSISIYDTINLFSSIANEHNLNDGKLEIKFYVSFSDSIPKTNVSQTKEVYNEQDYLLLEEKGGIVFNDNVEGLILGLKTVPLDDSIVMSYKFVPLKKGLFVLGFSSSFYEGKTQKARTDAFFDVENHFWSYYQVPGQDLPLPGSDEYKRYYFIAVTD